MSRLDEYDIPDASQPLLDFVDDVTTLWNNGKLQIPVVTANPSWKGNRGEMVLVITSAGSGRFMACTSHGSTTWTTIVSF